MSLHPGFLTITHGCEIIKAWEEPEFSQHKARRVQNKSTVNQIPLPYPDLEPRATVLKSRTLGPCPRKVTSRRECEARTLKLSMIRNRPRFVPGLVVTCQQPLS